MSSRHLTVLYPVLFAAYAVLFLYAENLRNSFPTDVVRPLLLAVVGAAIALALASAALRSMDRGALLAAALVVIFFFLHPPVIGLVQRIDHLISVDIYDFFYGPVVGIVFMLVALAVVAGAVVLTERAANHLPSINSALTVASVVLLAFPLFALAGYLTSARPTPAPAPSGLTATRATTRDIYHLILDQYGTNEAMATAFGVTDNDLPEWLTGHGFYVAADARANYNRTTLSKPATLSLDYHEALAAAMGPLSADYRPLHELIQDHRVGRFLREQGYRYVHLGNWYSPTGNVRIADENRRAATIAELEAKLLDASALPAISGLIGLRPSMPATEQLHVDSARFQFAALAQLADEPGPKYVIGHILLPHHPYVFDAAGNYLPASERRQMTVEEFVEAQLAYTNTEIKKVIERLLDRPPADQPIIVVKADEGPYPQRASNPTFDWATATPAELRTKYAILDAFYLPPEPNQPANVPEPYPTISSVNTYRLIFGRYFGVDLPLLPDRAFAARTWERPYDQIEVTDALR